MSTSVKFGGGVECGGGGPLAPFSPLAWQKQTDRHHQQPLSAQNQTYQTLIRERGSQRRLLTNGVLHLRKQCRDSCEVAELGYVIRLWGHFIQVFWEENQKQVGVQKYRSGANALTGCLGLDPKFETRFVNREPHEHIFRAEPPDVPRTRGAKDVKKVDDPITPPRTLAFCHASHLLDGRLWG